MNILLLGAGGREHALAWKLNQSPLINRLFIAPGNAGTATVGTNVDIQVNEFDKIAEFCIRNTIEMLVVGPEDPLVNGVHDFLLANQQTKHLNIIGPQKLAAQLEGSKDFAKQFMVKNNIPTALYQSFTASEIDKAYRFLQTLKPPYVIKADGLAAGKGVVIEYNLENAKNELKQMFQGKFGTAGNRVVIEEFLSGIELSVFVLTDGQNYKILPEAKDYKRIGENDTGLNTGGMGAVSPVPFANKAFMQKVEQKIIRPTIEGLKKENIPYKGFIFIGLIKVDDEPYVIEYNVRLGDPETEVVLPRIESDLLEAFRAVGAGNLNQHQFKVSNQTAATVVLVSGSYPEKYEKGKLISGLNKVQQSIVFHAGTKNTPQGIVTDGGRVLAVTSVAQNMIEALSLSYINIDKINFQHMNFRTDIGFDLK